MNTVTSADGTTIAYETVGDGPPLVLVDGALCYRSFGPARPLAKHLADTYRVHLYDRRGRGDSGNTPPYAVDREIEDVAAVIDAAGGSAFVYGISSGAALALAAANAGLPIKRLAVYEAPFLLDENAPPEPPTYRADLERALSEGRRGDAVAMFMRMVGAPSMMVKVMKLTPAWRKLKGVAHTLPYDHDVLADARAGQPLPEDRYAEVARPVLSMAGGKSPEWMRTAMQQVAAVLPDAEYRTIEGQTHMLKPQAVAPLLRSFFR